MRDLQVGMARARLIDQVLYATTRDEVRAATQALTHWMEEPPDDLSMADGFEQLANMQEIAGSRKQRSADGSPERDARPDQPLCH